MLIEDTNQLSMEQDAPMEQEQSQQTQAQSEPDDDLFDDDSFMEDTNLDDDLSDEGRTQDKTGNPVKIPVRFLGEDREVSLDEAIPLIQKGMNYDHKHLNEHRIFSN